MTVWKSMENITMILYRPIWIQWISCENLARPAFDNEVEVGEIFMH